ncbi:hypothetical protein PR202_gb11558 [Eleusine coracana subsp. coracana]|uniref:Uncharacterized protein n=1 Tax=Eleusine coracana subsp. coracana TaxID=191504 RepID=A0AAV5EM77_ELECO|nr:hypothetical protein PR202_gb11558 [Eleusine coracana subsp. coracana]
MINKDKSAFSFSKNTNTVDRATVKMTLEIQSEAANEKYLGFQCILAGPSKKVFSTSRIKYGNVFKDGRRSFYPRPARRYLLKQWHKPFPPMPCLVLTLQNPSVMILAL